MIAALLVCASVSLPGCRTRKSLAERLLEDPADELATARCGGVGQAVNPLIIEWPATDRASLESRLRRGVVVVHFEDCVVEVLRHCTVPAVAYNYVGITRKNDQITIRSTDELYANMPLTAVDLEAKLAKAGELSVLMALVGNYAAQREYFDISELQGRCQDATHVIAAAQVGAFEFYTGAAAEIGAELGVQNVAGFGGRSTASRQLLSRDGDATACQGSTPSDTVPPNECGALVRLELSELGDIGASCQSGSVWNGSACVVTRVEAEKARPVTEDESAKQSTNEQVEQMARQMCEIVRQCERSAHGLQPSQGDASEQQMQRCLEQMKMVLGDGSHTEPIRKCIADAHTAGCEAFESCMNPPEIGLVEQTPT